MTDNSGSDTRIYRKIPIRSLKQTAGKHVIGKTRAKIKDKAQPMKEIVSDKLDGIKTK